MPFLPGKPRPANGGRRKGTPNRRTEEIQEMLRRVGCNPLEGLALLSERRITCGTCIDAQGKPTGVTRYLLPDGQHAKTCKAQKYDAHGSDRCKCMGIAERTCLSCFGTLRERIGADLKFKADAELAQYVAPKRKAIEVSGDQNNPVRQRVEIIYRDAPGEGK